MVNRRPTCVRPSRRGLTLSLNWELRGLLGPVFRPRRSLWVPVFAVGDFPYSGGP